MASTAESSRTAIARAPPPSSGGASSNARAPVEAFSADVLENLEHMLERDAKIIALDANKRAHIRMLLDDKYEVKQHDFLDKKKPKNEYNKKHSELHRIRAKFDIENN